MSFLAENWFFVLILLACIAMHFFMHDQGGHGSDQDPPSTGGLHQHHGEG